MGRGPDALLAGGLVEQLREQGRTVVVERIEADDTFPLEVGTAFELARRLAICVRAALDADQFPLVLAGNCFTALGTLGGLGQDDIAVAWFDCHGDFHTPQTTASGFLDGMALSSAVGQCWPKLAATIPGFRPVQPQRVLHLAGRDFDPGEREAMTAAGVRVCDAETLRRGSSAVEIPWSDPAAGVYAHIDLDALDPQEGAVNKYQAPGGLSIAAVEYLLRHIGCRSPIRAAALTAYDPSCDAPGRVPAAALRLVRCLANM